MLMEVKKTFQLIGYYFKINLSSVLEYRVSFMLQFFGMILNNASFIVFWWFLFKRIPTIEGYAFKDIMILWALASAGFGLCFVLFGNVRYINELVVKGELDTFLLQPKEILIHVLISKTSVSAWGDVVYGFVLFGFIAQFNGVYWLLFLLFVVTGSLIFCAVLVIINSLAFWFGNIGMVAQVVFEALITLTIYPEQIYKGFSKILIYTLLPAAYITLIPRNMFVDFKWQGLITVLCFTLFSCCMAFAVFYKGLKKYESGNQFTKKL